MDKDGSIGRIRARMGYHIRTRTPEETLAPKADIWTEEPDHPLGSWLLCSIDDFADELREIITHEIEDEEIARQLRAGLRSFWDAYHDDPPAIPNRVEGAAFLLDRTRALVDETNDLLDLVRSDPQDPESGRRRLEMVLLEWIDLGRERERLEMLPYGEAAGEGHRQQVNRAKSNRARTKDDDEKLAEAQEFMARIEQERQPNKYGRRPILRSDTYPEDGVYGKLAREEGVSVHEIKRRHDDARRTLRDHRD